MNISSKKIKNLCSEVTIRYSREEDFVYWKKWVKKPEVLRFFPMCDDREIEDAVQLIRSYIKQKAVLTAEVEGSPCGVANLYLQPYKKLSHQSLFAILIGEGYRGKGIGSYLLEELIRIAKENFQLEVLHLEVYENNPARSLYERLGFTQFGVQKDFLQDDGSYLDKYFMQKIL